MKFSKVLQSRIKGTEWERYYISYKTLKDEMKKVAQMLAEYSEKDEDLDNEWRQIQNSIDEWFRMLDQELQKTANFYFQLEGKILSTLQELDYQFLLLSSDSPQSLVSNLAEVIDVKLFVSSSSSFQ